jgi:diguanylate cyclase (GGDEF)-like protein
MSTVAPSPSTDDAYLRARIDAVYALNLPMLVMDMLGCCLIAWFYWHSDTAAVLAGWLLVNAIVMAPRIAAALAYRSGRFPSVRPKTWAASLVLFAGFSGLMWGGALAWMVAVGSADQVMFVMCVALSGLTLSIANVAYWPVYVAFAAPVTLAAALGFAVSDRPGGAILSFGAVAMTVALIGTSRELASQILRAQKLAVTNQGLIDSLGERSRELERACHVLEQVSRTDPLTGLANRRSCDARLEAEWARAIRLGASLAVIAIDVDHFKRYNDTHGHAEGDRCLRAVGAILSAATRGAIDLATRYGGEEFMLILPGIDVNAAASTAERIRVRVATGTADPAVELPERVTVSLGVALIEPTPGGSIDQLTLAADAALYRAKMGGRNRYEIAPSLAAPDAAVA